MPSPFPGKFVIVWEERSGGQGNIRARRYNSAGIPSKNVTEVANSTSDEKDPSIGMVAKSGAANDGAFVVTYTVGWTAHAVMYSKFGFRIKDFDVGGSLGDSNTRRGGTIAARSADGSFLIGLAVVDPLGATWWDGTETALSRVFVFRYDATGKFLGQVQLGSDKIFFGYSLTIDAQGHGRFAYGHELLDAIDGPIADVIEVGRIDIRGNVIERSTIWTGNGSTMPVDFSIASNPMNKGYVIAFTQTGATRPTTIKDRVTLIEVSATGKKLTRELGANHNEPSVAIGFNNVYLVSYTTTISVPVDPGKGIFARFGRIA